MERVEGLANIKALGIERPPIKIVALKAKIEKEQTHFVYFMKYEALKTDEKGQAWGFFDTDEEFVEWVLDTAQYSHVMKITAAIAFYAVDPIHPFYMLSHGYQF